MHLRLRADLSLLFPAFILSLTFIDLSTGTLVALRPVVFFYIYTIFFLAFRAPYIRFRLNLGSAWPYLLVVGLYAVTGFLGTNWYKTVEAELFNVLWWSIFSVFLALELYSKERGLLFMKYLAVFLFIGSFIAALLGLYKVYMLEVLLELLPIAIDPSDNTLLQGSTLNADYNLYTLGLIFGVFCGKFLKENSRGWFPAFLSYVTLPCFMAAIFFSGSRRGLFFGMLTLLIYFYFSFSVNTPASRIPVRMVIRFIGIFSAIVIIFFAAFSLFEKAIEDAGFVSGVQRLTTIKEQLTDSKENERTKRWVYINENLPDANPVKSLLIGRGFSYLRILGNQFNYGSDDNPHNFLVATFLYGGLLSLTSLVLLLFIVLRITARNGVYTLFFYFTTLTVIFSLTSSHTLFAYRFLPVLLLVPILTRFRTAPGMDKKQFSLALQQPA